MKKKSLLFVMLMILVLVSATGCGSSSNNRDWKKDAYEQGYYKGTDGKWYHR